MKEKIDTQFEEIKNKLEAGFTFHPPNFQEFCDEVTKTAKEITDSDIALLYLTAEHKILEAVGRAGEEIEKLEPSQIPFYRLDWDIPPKYENIYDGFTAWATLHIKPGEVGIMVWENLKDHPAHKGQWDPIVWRGTPQTELRAIMFTPLSGGEEDYCKCYGLLKVELSTKRGEAKQGGSRYITPFNDEQKQRFQGLAKWVYDSLNELDSGRRAIFWSWFVARSASQKTQHLMNILLNWRSAEYNITEGLGFVLEFFRLLAGAEHGIFVLQNYYPWRDPTNLPSLPDVAYVMPYWRPSWEKREFKPILEEELERSIIPKPAFRSSIPNGLDNRTCLTFLKLAEVSKKELSEQLAKHGGIGTVRKVKNLDLDLLLLSSKESIKVEVKKSGNTSISGAFGIHIKDAWLIDLRGSQIKFGTIVIPIQSNTNEENKKKEDLEKNLERTLTSNATALSRVLERILTSEFDVRKDSCLPIHHPVGLRKLVIGFVDIRNFSTVTRILRLMGSQKLAAIKLLMQHFCRIIAEIGNKWGRLDKFMGDGAMLLFGEDILLTNTNEDEKIDSRVIERSVLVSICFGIAILKIFNIMKDEWLRDNLSSTGFPWRFPEKVDRPLLRDIKTEHCEDIGLGLGIALNLGNLHMDYFGDIRGRAYSAIGDNVNLCARICDEAGKYDYETGKERSPILVTQPIFEYLKGYLTSNTKNQSPLRLQLRGLGFDYPVWEIRPEDLLYGKIQNGLGGTRYKQIFDETFEAAGKDWKLKENFIRDLGL